MATQRTLGSEQPVEALATPVVFWVTFDEPVTGFDVADVTIAETAGATSAVVAGSGAFYTVTVASAGQVAEVKVAGRGGVPVDAEAVF